MSYSTSFFRLVFSTVLCLACGASAAHAAVSTLLFDDFNDGNRDGFFLLDSDIATLEVSNAPPAPATGNYLRLQSASANLSTFLTYFSPFTLQSAGDNISLSFDVYNVNGGFIDAGFAFGLFNSNGTRINASGDLDFAPASLDDNGIHALIDVGGSTTFNSALLRMNNNNTNTRMFGGDTFASASNGTSPDPLMLTENTAFRYTLELTRLENGSLNALLFNNESGIVPGPTGALFGNLAIPNTYTFDTIYFGGNGDTNSSFDVRIDNITVTATAVPEPSTLGLLSIGLMSFIFGRMRRSLARLQTVS